MSGFEDWMAGARPKIIPVATARMVVNASTRASIARSCPTGSGICRSAATQDVEQPVGEQKSQAAAGQ